MKRLVTILLALTLLPGCSHIIPSSNQPPEAYIDSISPAEATEGQTVSLSGHGTDIDGEVVGYRWRSDRDGQLGSKREIETTSLSTGNHVIYFSVQDNNDAWSAEVAGSVQIIARPAAPTIDQFSASSVAITRGDSVTLEWKTSNVTHISIDPDIGPVAPDDSIVVTPERSITYILTATGMGTMLSASITITVEQSTPVVTLTADVDMSGFVRSLGIYTPGAVYVGDDSGDRGIQGFITFDISSVPVGATITRAALDMSRYEAPHESPFPDLGCLTAYLHNYDTLYGQYRLTGSLSRPFGEWCSFYDLDSPWDSPQLRNAVQSRVGHIRFQFRLQFADRETDGNHNNNLLYWSEGRLPTLTIEYQV